MQIIKFHTIPSTNDYLKQQVKLNKAVNNTIIWSENQTHGRGNIGTKWESQNGKNLTFSILKDAKKLKLKDQFLITIATSLAISDVLQKLQLKKIRIKWPNDILAEQKKICGILIESIIKHNKLEAVIIGIGLNINQTDFTNLPKATSILNQTGQHFEKEEILHLLISSFNIYTEHIIMGRFKMLHQAYEDRLFKRKKPATFKTPNSNPFTGIIQGVDQQGRLEILEEDNIVNTYALKEIQLLY